MIRGGPHSQPDDGPHGRPGWRAGARRRPPGPPPPQPTPPTPPSERPTRAVPPWRTERPRYSDDRYETYDRRGQPPPEPPPTHASPFTGPPPAGPPRADTPPPVAPPGAEPKVPRKITVTRVAAYRSRVITQQAVAAFKRAAHADGARESGLSALTYAVMINYASSATMAVGLANTLFFSAATAESRTKVALYLVITVAPFALIAPVIGPALDRIQHGRRLALAVSCLGQALLSVVMALHLGDWLLYPAALGTLVLSKSFDVLKAALTPRVLPSGITLSKTNARLAVFGLGAGMAFGAVGSGFAKLFGSPGALWFTAVLCLADAVLCLRIPSWVEVTEGEVPASLRVAPTNSTPPAVPGQPPRGPRRQPMGRNVVLGLWGNATIRLLTGFLMLFPAFVIKSLTEHSPGKQLLLLGLIGAAAGIGTFAGNAIGARLQFGRPDQVIISCLAGALGGTVLAAVLPGIGSAAVAALLAAVASGLAKISLDATIQNDLPEASRASAFGRSETILQLSWVFGGALGVLLPTTFWIGFTVAAVLMAVGLVQTVLTARGQTLVPAFGGRRPLRMPVVGGRWAARGADPAGPPEPSEHADQAG